MKKSFINLSLVLGVIAIGGLGATTLVANAQTSNATNTGQAIEVNTIVEDIQGMYDKLNNQEISKKEQKEMVEYLKENLPTLIKANEPQIGDTVKEVGVWLELQQANKDIEEFGRYIDSIDLEQYQPMSEKELNALLNE